MAGHVPLPDKVAEIDVAMTGGGVPHAFGGALALAYYAEPRSTLDIDVNVFLEPTEAGRVELALEPLGVQVPGDRSQLERDAQTRWFWETTPIDLFFVNDPIHEAMRKAIRRVPFGDRRIPILSPEHLLLCKVAFDRPKDWIDIEQIAFVTPDLDRAEIERWIDRLLAATDARRDRLAALLGEPPT
jgi:hypothetical protein